MRDSIPDPSAALFVPRERAFESALDRLFAARLVLWGLRPNQLTRAEYRGDTAANDDDRDAE